VGERVPALVAAVEAEELVLARTVWEEEYLLKMVRAAPALLEHLV
jgi:hypothetical protein